MRTAAFVLIALALAAGAAPRHADAQSEPRFEVASVRRNVSADQVGDGLAGPQPGGRFIAIGATLRRLVSLGYDNPRVVGGPPWTTSDRFDVNAGAEGNPTAAEIVRMIRPLLADRFGLVVHIETREMPVYMLTARERGKPGSRLTQSNATCAEDARNFFPGAAGFPPPCGDYRLGARALTARGMTMARLADLLGDQVGRPVLDRTGLAGAFDIDLEWSSDLGLTRARPDSAGAGELRPDGLSLFTALQEQLGVRLDEGRGPVEVVVIDRAILPTPD